jgi:hypothetical protein
MCPPPLPPGRYDNVCLSQATTGQLSRTRPRPTVFAPGSPVTTVAVACRCWDRRAAPAPAGPATRAPPAACSPPPASRHPASTEGSALMIPPLVRTMYDNRSYHTPPTSGYLQTVLLFRIGIRGRPVWFRILILPYLNG